MTDTDATADVEGVAAEMQMLERLPPDTGSMPPRLAPDQLEELDLFQSRAAINGFHVESLARGLQHATDLLPVLVMRRSGRVFLIDGRHRKEAYGLARRADGVPVEEFNGTPAEAVLEGQKRNQQHTLAMTNDERMDGGWKLVKLDAAGQCRFTLPEIMASVGISRGQVTFMRRVLKELGSAGHQHMRWKLAQRAHKKTPEPNYTEEDIEVMHDAEAREFADKVARQYGTRYADRPEVMVRFIEYYTGRRVHEVSRLLQERNRELDDDVDF
ncbi:MAG: hypothetical protein P0Y65_18425 [Candidatus Devosia phytovorans]|uniref:ParB/Sulfiredoxin domain-containing protein n=1 Tax=Candidatus Devosia phytovorans TaxID=3121372 RepID=A0AAJ6B0E6_9HYPH|nr:hypothetical protein [Devosia sp.]WEK04134.1 MAG: hypothetical protein P0Y65_18425 [Devosia sp.]